MRKIPLITGLFALFAPLAASAHEVYVLDHATAMRDLMMNSPNPFAAIQGNEFDFIFWGIVSVVTVLTVFFSSIFRRVESRFVPLFSFLKKLAHPLVRITCGLCLISSGYYGALFGPELPFPAVFGSAAQLTSTVFMIAGALILAGFYTRIVCAFMLLVFAFAASVESFYMLTYVNYVGEFALLIILGSGIWSIDHALFRGKLPARYQKLARRFEPFAFPIMRILFGFGIVFASIYAKFVHSQLAIDVVTQYHLTDYFPFDPLFVVLGALIIEFLAGLFMMIGFEIRWTGLFLLFWLTLSLLYFGEAVWPHIVLFGIGLSLFFHGYDAYSVEGYFMKKGRLEPIL